MKIELEVTTKEGFIELKNSYGDTFSFQWYQNEELQDFLSRTRENPFLKQKENLLEISDSDVATIEAMYDVLLDNHGYSRKVRFLKEGKKLIDKMYKVLYGN